MKHPLCLGPLLVGCLASAVVALVTGGCAPAPPTAPVPTLVFATVPVPTSAQFVPGRRPSAARGAPIYRADCAACHGETGRGDGLQAQPLNPKPPNFTDPTYMRGQRPDEFYKAISQGVFGSAMLSWDGTLTTDQIWDVLFYVWSLHTTAQQIAAGRATYLAECASCHGENGDGRGAQATQSPRPPTALDNPRFLAAQTGQRLFDAVSNGARGVPGHAWSGRLSDDARRAVVEYVWTFLYDPAVP